MSRNLVIVREYARLTTEMVQSSLDCAQIPKSAFDWLCQLHARLSQRGVSMLTINGLNSMRLDSYVGVIETPCGTTLEILPKHSDLGDCLAESRALLRRMIQATLDLPTREVGQASLELFDSPITEWIMRQFLQKLDHIVTRGVRFDYVRVEEEQRFLRGQLNAVAQMRQPPGREHYFQIRHDVFVADRPENRLLKSALALVAGATQDSENWRLAHKLMVMLAEIPSAVDVEGDFRVWRHDRLMAHYEAVKPWCELILRHQLPLAVAGSWHGVSLLFPMEKLFERYVAAWLRRRLPRGAKLRTPAASEYLCRHDGQPMFRLEPDLLIDFQGARWLLDTKWKRLNAQDRSNKYGLSQADFYQLFAYGTKYLDSSEGGGMALIYPKVSAFQSGLKPFDLGQGLNLWVLPFDMEEETLIDADVLALPIKL